MVRYAPWLEKGDTMPHISITALNDLISIVHIPLSSRGLDDQYAGRVYWTIERAATESIEFFNLTSNRLEVAIFASRDLVASEWAALLGTHHAIRISEGWRVFEIDSGDIGDDVNSGNYDSPHLRHVSAPLSAQGISILYQSSYHADYLLVKESDFERAEEIFGLQGWTVNPTSTPSPRQSLYGSVLPSPFTPLGPLTPKTPFTASSLPPTLSTILASSPTQIPLHAYHIVDDNFLPRSQLGKPLSVVASPPASGFGTSATASPAPAPPSTNPSLGRHITLLPAPLAYVGFHPSSPHFQLHIGLIQKFLTWPIRTRAQTVTRPRGTDASDGLSDGLRPFVSYTRTQDGVSFATEVRVIRGLFRGREEGMMCGEEIGEEWESEAESDWEVGMGSDSDEGRDASGHEAPGKDEHGADAGVLPRGQLGSVGGRPDSPGTEIDGDADHDGVLLFGMDPPLLHRSTSRSGLYRPAPMNEGYTSRRAPAPDRTAADPELEDGDDDTDADDTPRAMWHNGHTTTPPPEYFSIPSRLSRSTHSIASSARCPPTANGRYPPAPVLLPPVTPEAQYGIAPSRSGQHPKAASVPSTPARGNARFPAALSPVSPRGTSSQRPRLHARQSIGDGPRANAPRSFGETMHPGSSRSAGEREASGRVGTKSRYSFDPKILQHPGSPSRAYHPGTDRRNPSKKEDLLETGIGMSREKRKGRKRCLQLDLSTVDIDEAGAEAYHLDKSGLVARFSTQLQRANIRMLYSSTFHTANILVEAGDVRRAKDVLAAKTLVASP